MGDVEDAIEILKDEVRDALELAERACDDADKNLDKVHELRMDFEGEAQHLKDQIDTLTQQLDEMLETIEELRQKDMRPYLEELVHNLAKRFGIPAVDLLYIHNPVVGNRY